MSMKQVVLIMAAATMPFALHAQPAHDSSSDRLGTHAVEYWAGYSARSPKWGVLGNRPGLSFAVAAGRIATRIKTTPRYALDYTFDIIPVALSSPPLGYDMLSDPWDTRQLRARLTQPCLVSFFGCRFPTGSAYGAGFSPLGLTATYRRDHILQPRLGATGGVLFFDRAVPTIISTRFNFTATVEAGVQALTKGGDGLLFVYRFHHLSNAGTGYDNSALASHVISIGARFGTRKP
jgi:hypothetical protein